MGWFGRKKEEKKKFDYSEETKELFAERDAYYAEQRRKLGGGDSNPEISNQKQEVETPSRKEDLEDLLGGSGDFNPYVNKEESAPVVPASAPSSQEPSSAYSCSSCGKEFQEKWGKCPSCGGEMKKAKSPAQEAPSSAPVQETSMPVSNNSDIGDPLDDLLGDFGSSNDDNANDSSEDSNNARIVDDDDNGPSTKFGSQISSHSNRKKVRKVRKVKRPRNK